MMKRKQNAPGDTGALQDRELPLRRPDVRFALDESHRRDADSSPFAMKRIV
jgi:hypothetical protein